MKCKEILWCHSKEVNDRSSYSLSNVDMSTVGWVKVKDVELEFAPLTAEEYAQGAVPLLRKHKAEIYAEAEVEAQKIEQQIQQLLALEYVGTASDGNATVIAAEGEPASDVDDFPF